MHRYKTQTIKDHYFILFKKIQFKLFLTNFIFYACQKYNEIKHTHTHTQYTNWQDSKVFKIHKNQKYLNKQNAQTTIHIQQNEIQIWENEKEN